MKTLSQLSGPRAVFRWGRRVFNLNDSRWGRGEEEPRSQGTAEQPGAQGARNQGNSGPPDLDELWRDFNRKLGNLFGRGGSGGDQGGRGGNGGFQPGMNGGGARAGVGLILGVLVLIWLSTGFFIVQEGQQAVITQFGKYKATVNAGFNWRLPYPIQRHELESVTRIRTATIGRDEIKAATGLKDSSMLTQDENILDIKFTVQYRLNDARAFLFESKDPADAVVQVAESAIREVVGKMKMDQALSEERDQIAPQVRQLMQTILDRYKVGIEVVAINLEQGGVRPPEQVQASFDDVLKAGQERERAKNEAQAYANDVVPRAVGTASRLKAESEAYRARVVAQAQGDAQRFRQVYAEYQKAPQVTRQRMYLDTMQQIYSNVTKVVVDSHQGSNLLYLPLDKLMQAAAGSAAGAAAGAPAPDSGNTSSAGAGAAAGNLSNDARSRDAARSRDRESR